MSYRETLKNCSLFSGLSDKEITALLEYLKANESSYSKNEIIVRPFEKQSKMGIVTRGSLVSSRTDSEGNVIILSILHKGEMFGQALSNTDLLADVSVSAQVESSVVWLDVKNLSIAEDYTIKFMHNLVKTLSEKLLDFNFRINVLSKKTIREKVLTMLSKQKESEIILSFNRNELADYLGVNRTALSRELSKMKSDGVINYRLNRFYLNTD